MSPPFGYYGWSCYGCSCTRIYFNSNFQFFCRYKPRRASQVAQWYRMSLPMQETQEMRDRSRVGKIPWNRKWQPAPVFLPGTSHGQRSRAGYSPQDLKEPDRTEHTGPTQQQHKPRSRIAGSYDIIQCSHPGEP